MKNLKKALVLVLAFAMVFGMFTINASAASFNDDEDIVNKEAVSTMSQLGIINGYEDGTFLPDQIVTRAEMCKMICVALNGGTAPILDSSTVVFSDTKGHWANAYISYCASKGIVSGDSGKGGAFRPDAAVTGLEAAKMMLVALGYNPAIAGFTGADWAQNVSMAANDKGLFTNLGSLNVVAGLSRDNAAQLIYNGLSATMVKYENVLSTDANGQLTSSPRMVEDLTAGNATKTIITNNYGATKYTAVLLANENGSFKGTKQDAGYTWIDVDEDGILDSADEIFKISTPADLLGKKVTIYVKKTATQTSKFWTVCGTPVATSDNKVVTFTGSRAPSQSQTAFDDAMKAQGIDAYTDAVVVENYGGNPNSVVPGGSVKSLADAYALRSNANGVKISFIDNNGDKDVDFVSIVALAVGKVATYNTTGDGYMTVTPLPGSNAKVDAISGEKMANVVGADTVAKDDIVTYYKLGTKWYVTKCNTATVTISAKEGANALAGTTTYRGSNLVNRYDEDGAQTTVAASVNIGKACTFYYDANGYVVYSKPAAADSKYLIVLASNDGTVNADIDPIRAKVLLQDGTFSTVSVSKIAGTAVSNSNKTLDEVINNDDNTGSIYTYKTLTDGTYDLTAVTKTNYTTTVTMNDPTIAVTNSVGASDGTATANAKTIFVYANAAATSASVYTGIANAPTRTGLNDNSATSCLVLNDVNGAKVVFAIGGVGTGTSKFIYVLSKTPVITLDSNSAPVYTYKTLVNGVSTDLVVTGAAASDAFSAVGLYRVDNDGTTKLEISADNKLAVASKLTVVATAADVVSCGNSVVAGQTVTDLGATVSSALTYNANTKVYVVNGKTVTESSIDEIAVITGSAANTSDILMTRASYDPANADYNVAGIVYIVKGLAAAAAPTALTMTAGTNAPTVADGTLLDGGSVTGWITGTADDIKIAAPTVPAGVTVLGVTINGTDYTADTDYTLAATGTYTVAVTTRQAGFVDYVHTYTFTVAT